MKKKELMKSGFGHYLMWKIHALVSPYFRRRRIDLFIKILNPLESTNILDVGGGADFWELSELTILNLFTPPDDIAAKYSHNFHFVKGDGRHLVYDNNSFDIVFSNSVIEHVGTFADQVRFANEALRVGKNVWIQTPAREFFIEQHTLTPFSHYLPKNFQKRLMKNFTLWGLIGRLTQKQCKEFLDSLNLLSYADLQYLFPECKILKEKFWFFTKSYTVVKK